MAVVANSRNRLGAGLFFAYDIELIALIQLTKTGLSMIFIKRFLPALCFILFSPAAFAAPPLVPHKALYDIDLVATRSGSQIINISGRMFYEWQPGCDAWTTDHRFDLSYEYADSPSMHIQSDFSTYELYDGSGLNFTSRRRRDGTLYQELRGKASIVEDKAGEAAFTMPEDLHFDLDEGTIFPMAHTIEMIEKARNGKKFFTATVFDGSDAEGPIEINSFIGKKANALSMIKPSKDIDMSLVNTPAWNVRMAVFPVMSDEETADYEMDMVFHENGVISDMLIEYDNFSVTQKLIALEKLKGDGCHSSAEEREKEMKEVKP